MKCFILTDTGRSWNNSKVSVRDKVETLKRGKDEGLLRGMNRMNRMIPAGLDGSKKKEFKELRFRSTFDIIAAAKKGLLPDKIMLNTHPQRWDDRFGPWVRPSETLLRRMLSACFTG